MTLNPMLPGATPLWAQSAKVVLEAEINVGAVLKVNQYQTDLRSDPNSPSKMTVTAKINADESETAAFSTLDGGASWTAAQQTQSGDPDVVYGNDGRAHWTFIDSANGQKTSYRRSKLGDGVWEAPRVISSNFIDHAHLWVDRSPTSPFQNSIYLAGRVGRQSVVSVLRSRDGGDTWAQTDVDVAGTIGQGFVDGPPCSLADGTLVVFARSQNTILSKDGKYAGSERKIYVLRSTDGGVSFSDAVLVRDFNTPPNPGSESSRSITGAVGVWNGAQRLYLVVSQTIAGAPSVLQISTSDDKGSTWSAPRTLPDLAPADKSAGGAVSLMANAQGVLGLQYFVFGGQNYDLYFSASLDGGATFLAPTRVSSATSTQPGMRSQPRELGGDQILGEAASDGSFKLVWTDNRDGDDQYTIYHRSARVEVLPPRP